MHFSPILGLLACHLLLAACCFLLDAACQNPLFRAGCNKGLQNLAGYTTLVTPALSLRLNHNALWASSVFKAKWPPFSPQNALKNARFGTGNGPKMSGNQVFLQTGCLRIAKLVPYPIWSMFWTTFGAQHPSSTSSAVCVLCSQCAVDNVPKSPTLPEHVQHTQFLSGRGVCVCDRCRCYVSGLPPPPHIAGTTPCQNNSR